MRLSQRERSAIRSAVTARFGPDARVFLFGSRTDDTRRGGDIDVYVETDLPPEPAGRARIMAIVDIQRSLGERKIDMVISPFIETDSLIRREIDLHAVPL